MAQYDPLAVKLGLARNLGNDTCRADNVAAAGLTTAAVVSGDACQINGALTLQKASAGLATPIVGIYDGTSGSVVRSGVVVATMAAGVVLTNGDTVYLSQTFGALTNVKPITDYLHEVGVVVDAASRKILLHEHRPVVVLPTGVVWVANHLGIFASAMSGVAGTKIGDTAALAAGCWHPCYDGVASIWITSSTGGGNIYQINHTTRALTRTIAAAGGAPNIPTGICSDGTYVYVCVHVAGAGRLYQYRISDGAAGWVATVGDNPYVPCYDNVNACIWVPNYVTNTVSKVRISDGGIVGSYATAAGPFFACFDGTRVWVSQRGGAANTVRRFTAATGASLGDVTVGNDPVGVCYDGTYVYVANRTDGTISKITAATGVVAATYAAVANIYGICYHAEHVWVPSTSLNNVTKIRAADGVTLGSYATGTQAINVCSAARRLPWT